GLRRHVRELSAANPVEMRLHPPLPRRPDRKKEIVDAVAVEIADGNGTRAARGIERRLNLRQLCFHRDIRETNEIRSRGAAPATQTAQHRNRFRREAQYRT